MAQVLTLECAVHRLDVAEAVRALRVSGVDCGLDVSPGAPRLTARVAVDDDEPALSALADATDRVREVLSEAGIGAEVRFGGLERARPTGAPVT